MRRKQNFEIVFRLESDTADLTFTFRFLSSPLFPLARHLVRLHFGGKSF